MRNTVQHLTLALLLALVSASSSMGQVVYYIGLDTAAVLPDTVQIGGQLQFSASVYNYGPLNFQGNVHIEMSNAQLGDTVTLATLTQSGGTVFSPNQPLQAIVNYTVTPNNALGIGGNVVVVWPRLDNGPATPPFEVVGSITKNIFVLPPNSVHERENMLKFHIHSIAGISTLMVGQPEKLAKVAVIDQMGRTCFEQRSSNDRIELPTLATGVYLLNLTQTDGTVTSRKVLIP